MDRNETIGVKTTLADGRVEQTIDGLTKRVVDIAAQHQEAAAREALTQLGWTPPEESEELRRDAERLNWLQDNPEHESVPYPEDGRWHVPYMVRSHGDVGSGVGLRTYETLRAAIDSARGVES